MNTLTKLKATPQPAPWRDDYPVANSVPVEPSPGLFGVLQLSPAGLALRAGNKFVAVPISELLALLAPNLGDIPAAPAPRPSGLSAVAARLARQPAG